MHLFMIIYLLGNVVGFVGPLDPLPKEQCEAAAISMLHDMEVKSGKSVESVELKCEYRETAPDIKDPVPLI